MGIQKRKLCYNHLTNSMLKQVVCFSAQLEALKNRISCFNCHIMVVISSQQLLSQTLLIMELKWRNLRINYANNSITIYPCKQHSNIIMLKANIQQIINIIKRIKNAIHRQNNAKLPLVLLLSRHQLIPS